MGIDTESKQTEYAAIYDDWVAGLPAEEREAAQRKVARAQKMSRGMGIKSAKALVIALCLNEAEGRINARTRAAGIGRQP